MTSTARRRELEALIVSGGHMVGWILAWALQEIRRRRRPPRTLKHDDQEAWAAGVAPYLPKS